MLTRPRRPARLAVLTSGGDAAGMNAAVRAVVRAGLHEGLDVFGVEEGLQAALHLVERGIDALVVVGGDGSLTGANLFRSEWPELLTELVEEGAIDRSRADAHRHLTLVGLVGSIDNDMFGTDMTIGADSALHRITEAIDAIHSTASSHQRSFVIEVMGRHCGYLALMSGLATGANWVLIPENPPDTDDWEESMGRALTAGRGIGRRQNMVIVAEGARDRHGNPITAEHVKSVLEERLGEDTRVTILGHVQRGGSPSAFDRYLSTVLGYAAVQQVLTSPGGEPQIIGIREHQIISSPMMDCVEKTRAVADVIRDGDYESAMEMRGGSFRNSFDIMRTMVRAQPRATASESQQLRLAVLHGGGPAPGMNTAVRVATRVGLDLGHTMLAVTNGFRGLAHGRVEEMEWMDVSGWVSRGGAELGTSRQALTEADLGQIAEQIGAHRIDGLLMIGGWAGYQAAHLLNDLPGSELSIGADTALNNIVSNVDKIKQSAVASGRCFVVEVMGRHCGYLALMSGLATGAERVYLPEEGVSLADLEADLEALRAGFRRGKRLGLVIRSEHVDPVYTTSFIRALFEREGGDLFDVRQSILGHIQQGGDPSPFDRIQATRLASRCVEYLMEQAHTDTPGSAFIGLQKGKVRFTDLADFGRLSEPDAHRPREQSWMSLRPIAEIMSMPTGG